MHKGLRQKTKNELNMCIHTLEVLIMFIQLLRIVKTKKNKKQKERNEIHLIFEIILIVRRFGTTDSVLK